MTPGRAALDFNWGFLALPSLVAFVYSRSRTEQIRAIRRANEQFTFL